MTEPVLKDVTFLYAEIIVDGKPELGKIDIGSITLSCEGREFKLDICQTSLDEENVGWRLTCMVVVDKETLDDCKYDLKPEDLLSNNLKAEIYIGGEFEGVIIENILYAETKSVGLTIPMILEE